MGWVSFREDALEGFDASVSALGEMISKRAPVDLTEAKTLHRACERVLRRVASIKKSLGDPAVDLRPRVLELHLTIDRLRDDNDDLTKQLEWERSLREKAERESVEAKKKVAAANGQAVKYGNGSGLIKAYNERIARLKGQVGAFRARVIQLSSQVKQLKSSNKKLKSQVNSFKGSTQRRDLPAWED